MIKRYNVLKKLKTIYNIIYMWNGKRKDFKKKKVITFLRNHIEEIKSSNRTQLQSIQSLAIQAGVSVVTMHRAVRQLTNEGLLTAAPRRGIQIVTSSENLVQENIEDEAEEYGTKKYKWEYLKERLLNDILRGSFGPKRLLPSKKVLCSRYNVSFQTLAKALQKLQDENWISTVQKGYTFNHSSGSAYGTIVVIAHHYNIDQLSTYVPHMRHFFSTLEQEQKRLHFKLRIFPYGFFFNKTKDEILNRTTIQKIEKENTVVGYLVLSIGLPYEKIQNVVRLLHTTKRPVAIFDNVGFAQNTQHTLSYHTRIFSIGTLDEKPGEEVAHYLLSRGHCNYAYFTSDPEPDWSKIRFSGITRALDSAGTRNSVRRFLYQSQCQTISHIKDIAMAPALNEVLRLERFYLRRHYTAPLQKFLYTRNITTSMFHDALQDHSITAWILPHDSLVIHAFYFLWQNGIDIPQNIALCSFDNSFEAFGHGITSYDFNANAAVYAILEYLFTPNQKTETRTINIPGSLIKRETTEMDSDMSTISQIKLTHETRTGFRNEM